LKRKKPAAFCLLPATIESSSNTSTTKKNAVKKQQTNLVEKAAVTWALKRGS